MPTPVVLVSPDVRHFQLYDWHAAPPPTWRPCCRALARCRDPAGLRGPDRSRRRARPRRRRRLHRLAQQRASLALRRRGDGGDGSVRSGARCHDPAADPPRHRARRAAPVHLPRAAGTQCRARRLAGVGGSGAGGSHGPPGPRHRPAGGAISRSVIRCASSPAAASAGSSAARRSRSTPCIDRRSTISRRAFGSTRSPTTGSSRPCRCPMLRASCSACSGIPSSGRDGWSVRADLRGFRRGGDRLRGRSGMRPAAE